MTNFWEQLESKEITSKEQVEKFLLTKLGSPSNQLSINCLAEIVKKITTYYQAETPKNYTIYSLVGMLTSPEQIIEKKFKEGKRMGQTYYWLKIDQEQLQACQEDIELSKWEQITNLAIVGQKLVFKYRKFYTNKQLLDFYPVDIDGKLGESLNGKEINETATKS